MTLASLTPEPLDPRKLASSLYSDRTEAFNGCSRLGCYEHSATIEVESEGRKVTLQIDHCSTHAALTNYLGGTDAEGHVWLTSQGPEGWGMLP